MNIEFGGGTKPIKKKYKQCDIRNLKNIDFNCHALEIKQFVENNTVDNIFSRHFLEHLSFSEGVRLLKIFLDILKPGGNVQMILPNMTFHINQWLCRKSVSEFNWSKAGFWGWQKHEYDFHKSGYDESSLREIVEKIGFNNFISLNMEDSPHLNVKFQKPL